MVKWLQGLYVQCGWWAPQASKSFGEAKFLTSSEKTAVYKQISVPSLEVVSFTRKLVQPRPQQWYYS